VFSFLFFFFKQKTAYEIGTGDWSSDGVLFRSGACILGDLHIIAWHILDVTLYSYQYLTLHSRDRLCAS